MRNPYKILFRKHEGKRVLGRRYHRRVNTKLSILLEPGYDNVDWIRLVQDKVHWHSCEHGNEPSGLHKS
jgi:hypothetical protein